MKQLLAVLAASLSTLTGFGQQDPMIASIEQQAEWLAGNDEAATLDDSFLQQLQFFTRHPLNLNTATEDELKLLLYLNDLQITNLVLYRRLLGNLVDIYELQAVPTWDIELIKKLLPYITIRDPSQALRAARHSWRTGENSLLIRSGQVVEKAVGFNRSVDSGSHYTGSPNRLYLRYKYRYKNMLQFGFQADKDAGEQFFKGQQKRGFDFYSFHIFVSKPGLLRVLALGDFTVNMGQGLIQWQTMAFKKSADITALKRQSSFLKPYTSGGEANFERGAGAEWQRAGWTAGVFLSIQKLSGNLEKDSLSDPGHITSFMNSGYHRTASEINDKNNITQKGAGFTMAYQAGKWHVGVNAIHFELSHAVEKRGEPYNLWALAGKTFSNASIDYSVTYKNVHFFGEAATDRLLHPAFLNGLLVSAAPGVNISLVHRSISSRYQVLYANAFTENFAVNNENGLFAGLSLALANALTLQAYGDMFSFPWLKYRVDAPSNGSDYLVRLSYVPNKMIEYYTRFKVDNKTMNRPGELNGTSKILTSSWRLHASMGLNKSLTLRNRCEFLIYDQQGPNRETGFLYFSDILFKPRGKPWDFNARIQYFETDGYNSRIYAFENDVLYDFSIPSLFDHGYRYYLNAHADLSKSINYLFKKKAKADFYLRLAQTIYTRKLTAGSGLGLINNNKVTEINMQVLVNW